MTNLFRAYKELLKDFNQMVTIFKHSHVAKYVDDKLVDWCDKCGLDMRHPIHTSTPYESAAGKEPKDAK